MNRRDLMKTAAAVAAIPSALLGAATQAIAARRELWSANPAPVPVPAYSFDSRSRRMTQYCSDETTRAMHAYLHR